MVGVDFPLRDAGKRIPGSDTAERGSWSSCVSGSSSSVIVGRCSESSPEWSELLSPCDRFDLVPVLSDLDAGCWSGYSHSRLPLRQPDRC